MAVLRLGQVANGGCDRLHAEGRSRGFKVIQVSFEIRGCFRIEQGSGPRDARRNLLEQLQPLAAHRGFKIDESGDVATRSLQARDEAAADRIDKVPKNDGDDARFLKKRRSGGCA
jgi:hypothetical protein